MDCPLPISKYDEVQLGHGSGGKMSAELLRDIFYPAFQNEILDQQEDQASLPLAALGAEIAGSR